MDTVDFLRSVWPDQGKYCLLLITKDSQGHTRRRHIVRDTIEEATADAIASRSKADVYFCVHSLRKARVWDENKKDFKTGAPGAWAVRKHDNMFAAACFFADLDIGDTPNKFADQTSAIRDLKAFCVITHLPLPTLVSSGRGVHCYWPISAALSSDAWCVEAAKLKRLMQHYELKVDPVRVEDQSSVLRVPGTLHHKDPTNPRSVDVLAKGATTDTPYFIKLLNDALIAAGLPATRAPPDGVIPGIPVTAGWETSNLNIEVSPNFEPVSIATLGSACAQVRWMVAHQDQVTEPMWYALLGVVRFVENGEHFCHVVSEAHPGYDRAQTDVKIAQLEKYGPTTCGKIQQTCGDGAARCAGCPFQHQTDQTPLTLARKLDKRVVDPPKVVLTAEVQDADPEEIVAPAPPEGYLRLKEGGIALLEVTKEGKEVSTIIYPYDLFPYQLIHNSVAGTLSVVWRTWLPKGRGWVDFVTTVNQLFDARLFMDAVGNSGVLIAYEHITAVRVYMIAYLKELQKYAEDHQQHSHLGWDDSHTKFVLRDVVLSRKPDGEVRVTKACVSSGVTTAADAVSRTQGTFEKQLENFKFYEDDAYVARQFLICCAFGSPIYYMTGHGGAIVNMSGETGASKSTALYLSGSLWGSPRNFVIDGTARGSTVNARQELASVLSSIPVCVDEITGMEGRDAQSLALSASQFTSKIRLNRAGEQRKLVNTSKCTLMLTTGNDSLHELLSQNNAGGTAASMRVFEIPVVPLAVHEKWQADDLMINIINNYGFVGPQFMRRVVHDQPDIQELVQKMMRVIDREANIQQSERFWSAVATAGVVGCMLARKYGFLTYHPETILHWLVKQQIKGMRTTVVATYSSPLDCLTEYMDSIIGDTLCVQTGPNNVVSTMKGINRELLARFEYDTKIIYLQWERFKSRCQRNGIIVSSVLNYIVSRGIGEQVKVTLGRGTTEFQRGQVRALKIDTRHPEVTGAFKVIEGKLEEEIARKGAPKELENVNQP